MGSRVDQPPRSEIPEAERADYDSVTERFTRLRADRPDEVLYDGHAGPYFGALLNSPPLARALTGLGTMVRTRSEMGSSYTHADRELVDQVLQFDWGWQGVQRTHLPDALAVGVRLEAIEALRDGRDEDLSASEREIVSYVRQVVSGTVSDDSFNAISERMGRRGAVEYTIFIAFLLMTLRLHQAFGAEDGLSADDVNRWISEFRSGTRPLPDARVRFA
jgi:hypothetical protein